MTIWLAALYSLGILGASAIFFALCVCLIKWAVESEHVIVLWAVVLIGVFIVLTAEGGTA